MDVQIMMRIMTDVADAAVQTYMKSIEPNSDRIKQTEAKEYLCRRGYKPGDLKKWVQAKMLHPVKLSHARNAAVGYSLSEIKCLIAAYSAKQLL